MRGLAQGAPRIFLGHSSVKTPAKVAVAFELLDAGNAAWQLLGQHVVGGHRLLLGTAGADYCAAGR